jgi:phosphopantetheinyl transferase
MDASSYATISNTSVRRLTINKIEVYLSTEARDRLLVTSSSSAKLAERMVAVVVGCEHRHVRVARLMPSGRPVATIFGRHDSFFLSISHFNTLVGAALCLTNGIGIDIINSEEVPKSVEFWFSPHEASLLSEDDSMLRARLWSAKEAAFKAARLDIAFDPHSIAICDLSSHGFNWSVRTDFRLVNGEGVFVNDPIHIIAVAITIEHHSYDNFPCCFAAQDA